jgi:hypothetical protein
MAKPAYHDQLQQWAGQYRAAARSDKCRKLLAWYESHDGSLYEIAAVRRMVKSTIELVRWACAWLEMNRGPLTISGFLRRQVYDPRRSRTKYVLQFEPGHDHPWPHLLVDQLRHIDLDDLYSSPGFRHLTIRHTDGSGFARGEHARLEKEVRNDFFFDAAAPHEEITLGFDRDGLGLHVMPRPAHGQSGA